MNVKANYRRDAHAGLLPAFASLDLAAKLRAFPGNGGRALLLGETRAE